MKEFIYEKIIDEGQAKKIIRRLIYTFFKGNIYKKKIMMEGKLQDKTFFSFKRPFSSDDGKLSSPDELHKIFPQDELYVLRHYRYKDNNEPLFLELSSKIQLDLEDVDSINFYEYSYIFDKQFSYCFFVTDSTTSKDGKSIAILKKYEPI
ncbi:hypothetical protein [Neisseria dumasiana]|uniref:Uncharacterized protein n=1 Tax=Neisseria dumasiana TaxID=1931275 RepID=A0ABX3WK67_9NEIS|nr:hypothetical protein [Neisseria dumasiana]OSI33154.1 hypothetical protein BV913_09110 [Neisseria dumasiana]UOO83593.1 hypothetical protein LVJ88_07710 [Neisseria dumasiana]UOO83596.1 hypothetical protein LVJ88_07725 [Neisseria dumasiana]